MFVNQLSISFPRTFVPPFRPPTQPLLIHPTPRTTNTTTTCVRACVRGHRERRAYTNEPPTHTHTHPSQPKEQTNERITHPHSHTPTLPHSHILDHSRSFSIIRSFELTRRLAKHALTHPPTHAIGTGRRCLYSLPHMHCWFPG